MPKKIFVLILLCCLSSRLFASRQVGLLTLGGGFLKPHEPRGCFYLEYKDVLPKFSCIRPLIGIMTEEARSLYLYAGLGIDLHYKNLVFTPSFAPGLYFRERGAVRLWFPIEFRSSLELAWQLSCKARVGFGFFHLSNASLGERNPGVNAGIFFVSFPFGKNCF